jgi:hypothetical protein
MSLAYCELPTNQALHVMHRLAKRNNGRSVSVVSLNMHNLAYVIPMQHGLCCVGRIAIGVVHGCSYLT